MEPFTPALKNIALLMKQREEERLTSNTPTDGSPMNPGITTTPLTPVQVATPLASKEEVKRASSLIMPVASSKSEPNEPLDWRARPIHESLDAQNALTSILTKLHVTQKRYGESSDSLRIRDKDFQKKLGRFCLYDVAAAIEEYTLHRDDIPAAANILRILQPPPPIPDRRVVMDIQQRMRNNQYVSDDDKELCNIFRRREVERVLREERQYQQRLAGKPSLQLSYQPIDQDENA